MHYDSDSDEMVFKTGTRLYVNLGIVGLSPTLSISAGYDNGIGEEELSKAEKIELADYMLARWQRYKHNLV